MPKEIIEYTSIWNLIGWLSHDSQNSAKRTALYRSDEFQALYQKLSQERPRK